MVQAADRRGRDLPGHRARAATTRRCARRATSSRRASSATPTVVRIKTVVGRTESEFQANLDPAGYSWRFNDQSPGGHLFDDVMHKYAMALWLVDEHVRSVQAIVRQGPLFFEAPTVALWEYARDDLLGMMEVSYAPDMFIRSDYYGADEFFEIQGTRGLRLGDAAVRQPARRPPAARALRGRRPPDVVRGARRVVRRLVPPGRPARSSTACSRARRPTSSPQTGIEALQLAFAVYQASNERRRGRSQRRSTSRSRRTAGRRATRRCARDVDELFAREAARAERLGGGAPTARRKLTASTPPFDARRASLLIALAANAAFLVVELVGGFAVRQPGARSPTPSHMTSDVLALALALAALVLAQRPPTERHTFGFERTEVLAAQANGVLLLVGAIGDRDRGDPPARDPADRSTRRGARRRCRSDCVVNVGSAVVLGRARAREPQPPRRVLASRADALGSLAVDRRRRSGRCCSTRERLDSIASLFDRGAHRRRRVAAAARLDPRAARSGARPTSTSARCATRSVRPTGVEAVHHLHVWTIGCRARRRCRRTSCSTGPLSLHDAQERSVELKRDARRAVRHRARDARGRVPCLRRRRRARASRPIRAPRPTSTEGSACPTPS